MDFALVLEVLKRRKLILFGACLIGIVFAFLSAYDIDFSGKSNARFHSRSQSTCTVTATMMIGDPQFSLGLAGMDNYLPKTINLAPIYAKLIMSDLIMDEVSRKLGGIDGAVTAMEEKNAPIFSVNVTSVSPQKAQAIANTICNTFIGYVRDSQEQYKIKPWERIYIRKIGQPKVIEVQGSRTWEIALMAFIGPVLLTIFALLTIYGARQRLSAANNVAQDKGSIKSGV
jgi:capsular polysaccharide biosynthesis protein